MTADDTGRPPLATVARATRDALVGASLVAILAAWGLDALLNGALR